MRNYTTSHVHMMLSTALTEMIDKTECIIFFNTPNSINLAEELEKVKTAEKKHTTTSPWIYHELSMTTMLRAVEPVRFRTTLEHFARDSIQKPQFIHYVDKELAEMTTLTDCQLMKWQNNWTANSRKNGQNALDELYKIVFPNSK